MKVSKLTKPETDETLRNFYKKIIQKVQDGLGY